jgi:hypothetical protein
VNDPAKAPEEPPPFASWPVLYGLVIAALLVVILLLAWLTGTFTPR